MSRLLKSNKQQNCSPRSLILTIDVTLTLLPDLAKFLLRLKDRGTDFLVASYINEQTCSATVRASPSALGRIKYPARKNDAIFVWPADYPLKSTVTEMLFGYAPNGRFAAYGKSLTVDVPPVAIPIAPMRTHQPCPRLGVCNRQLDSGST